MMMPAVNRNGAMPPPGGMILRKPARPPAVRVTRRAVIDIGTNSVKLLVADVCNGAVQPVFEDSEQTRLGASFYKTQRLQPQAVTRTARAVATFYKQARETGATSTRIIATSAARDAMNPATLTTAVERACAAKVDIISGEQEADLVYRGVTSAPELARRPLLLLDVGGGSTEFILGRGPRRRFCHSYPIGALRLMQSHPASETPTRRQLASCRKWVRDFLACEVLPKIRPALRRERKADAPKGSTQLIGTGGTATILGRMEGGLASFDRSRIEGVVLSLDKVRAQVERLWSMPLARRKQLAGLPKSRADVILFGTVIYEGVMESLGFDQLRISTRGLRFAAVLDPAR